MSLAKKIKKCICSKSVLESPSKNKEKIQFVSNNSPKDKDINDKSMIIERKNIITKLLNKNVSNDKNKGKLKKCNLKQNISIITKKIKILHSP